MRIISGEFRGRKIKTPLKKLNGFRPATYKVRQAIFSMLISRGMEIEGCRAIDLFAGTGSLGFECLSRGAQKVWFVEKDPLAVKYLKENLTEFNISPKRYKIIPKDVIHVVKRPPSEKFHLCFIDPPYRQSAVEPVLKKLIQNRWIIENGFIVSEVEDHFSLKKEIPELTLIVNKRYGQTRILIWTVTIKN
jgi:16S rRNA (guanine966-N2)-methyltransferase